MRSTSDGAGTVATTEHPDLQRAQDWHREHVRRQGCNTSTQQQNSNWQCQGFAKSSEWITRTHTFTYVERDPASGDRMRDVERDPHDLSGRCGLTLHRTYVFSAFMHCAL